MKILVMILLFTLISGCTPTAKESEEHKDLPEPKNVQSDQKAPNETKEQDPNWVDEPLSPTESQKRSMKVIEFTETNMKKEFPETGYPDYFGGMYYNPVDQKLHLLLTDLDRELDLYQYMIDWDGVRFALDEVRYSYVDLIELSDAMTEVMPFNTPAEVDVERNLVVVNWPMGRPIAKADLYEALSKSKLISEDLLDQISKEGEIDAVAFRQLVKEDPIHVELIEDDKE